MPDCKACGAPAKIIKVNRGLIASQKTLQEEVRELRSKYKETSKLLNKAEKSARSAKETITNLRFDRKQARAETVAAWVRVRSQEKQIRRQAQQEERLKAQNAVLVARLSQIQAAVRNVGGFNG